MSSPPFLQNPLRLPSTRVIRPSPSPVSLNITQNPSRAARVERTASYRRWRAPRRPFYHEPSSSGSSYAVLSPAAIPRAFTYTPFSVTPAPGESTAERQRLAATTAADDDATSRPPYGSTAPTSSLGWAGTVAATVSVRTTGLSCYPARIRISRRRNTFERGSSMLHRYALYPGSLPFSPPRLTPRLLAQALAPLSFVRHGLTVPLALQRRPPCFNSTIKHILPRPIPEIDTSFIWWILAAISPSSVQKTPRDVGTALDGWDQRHKCTGAGGEQSSNLT